MDAAAADARATILPSPSRKLCRVLTDPLCRKFPHTKAMLAERLFFAAPGDASAMSERDAHHTNLLACSTERAISSIEFDVNVRIFRRQYAIR
jgi:hypothetical protein